MEPIQVSDLKKISDTFESAGSEPADFSTQNILGYLTKETPGGKDTDDFVGLAEYLEKHDIEPYIASTETSAPNAISSLLSALPKFSTPYWDIVLKFYRNVPSGQGDARSTDDSFYIYLGPRVQEFSIPFPKISKTTEWKVGGMTIKRPASEIDYPTHATMDILEDASFTFLTFFNHLRRIDYPLYSKEQKEPQGGSDIHDIVNYYTQNGYTFDVLVLINRDPRGDLPTPGMSKEAQQEPQQPTVKVTTHGASGKKPWTPKVETESKKKEEPQQETKTNEKGASVTFDRNVLSSLNESKGRFGYSEPKLKY